MRCLTIIHCDLTRKNPKIENTEKFVKMLKFCTARLLSTAIWREKFRKFKTQKNSWKCWNSPLLDCYPLRFHEKNSKIQNTKKIHENTCTAWLLFLAISREKFRKFKRQKNSWKCNGSALLDCYPLRFDEKNFENSKHRKIRENTAVSHCLTIIHCDLTRKIFIWHFI